MLTPLTPNLLAAVCLFFECSLSPARFFNYTLPCVLSEYIIQNEMHLENIKITNAHHYSHNFNLAWCLFWFWLWFILYVLSIPSQMAVCPLPAWESHINYSKQIILPPSHELQVVWLKVYLENIQIHSSLLPQQRAGSIVFEEWNKSVSTQKLVTECL